jgi:nitrite reductase/ring-hydroxylating ferredoxin subunit/uncharacterized membrane protein
VAGWRTFAREAVAERLARLDWLDAVAAPVQQAVGKAIPNGTAVKDALSGTGLGHPLHPPLTDVVVGSWVSSFVLDLLGGRDRERASSDLIALGIVAAVPTALTGASDWADVGSAERRVGLVHATANTTALVLQTASWRARRRGSHGRGVLLSTAALGVASVSAWLGGHLSFARGVGVDETAFEEPPTAWTAVIDDEKLESRELVRRSARGTAVLLVRSGGKIHALLDRCNHRGCSLSEGELDGAAITCPCHGSRFALDGTLLRGPATGSQRSLETRVHEGKVEVRARSG